MADLQKDADAVAGLPVCVYAGSVLQMLHDGQRVIDNLMGRNALDIHNGSDTAAVPVVARIAQPCRRALLRAVFHVLHLACFQEKYKCPSEVYNWFWKVF